MPCEYFLLIRRQRRPCLLAIDDGLSLAGQHGGRVRDYLGELVLEEIFHPLWSSTILYQLPQSTTIHSILPVWQSFCTKSSFDLFLGLEPPLHTPYIFSPNQYLLFSTHAYTIATCFAVVPRLCPLPLVLLSSLYLELYLYHHTSIWSF